MSTPLEELGYPLTFRVEDPEEVGIDTPEKRLNQAQRTRVRSLEGMQKEALVSSTLSRATWRFASDEGPYLDGADVAPPPLAYMLTGMVSSYMTELLAVGMDRGHDLRDVTLVLDNYYGMSGSALQGTMTASALDPQVTAVVDEDSEVDPGELGEMLRTAVTTSPVNGLLDEEHTNSFKLNGRTLEETDLAELDEPLQDDPKDAFERLPRPDEKQNPPYVRHTGETTEPPEDYDERYTEGEGSSLEGEQDRIVHLRGICTMRPDGTKLVRQKTFSPRGSIFEFISDEPSGHGGQGRAPDSMTYVAAGLGFCFMTQLGRYAEIVDEELSEYRIVQDTHFSLGGSTAVTDSPGRADPAETHVFLHTPAGDDFAREAVEMSEQTCFLHAACRSLVEPQVAVETRPAED